MRIRLALTLTVNRDKTVPSSEACQETVTFAETEHADPTPTREATPIGFNVEPYD